MAHPHHRIDVEPPPVWLIICFRDFLSKTGYASKAVRSPMRDQIWNTVSSVTGSTARLRNSSLAAIWAGGEGGGMVNGPLVELIITPGAVATSSTIGDCPH